MTRSRGKRIEKSLDAARTSACATSGAIDTRSFAGGSNRDLPARIGAWQPERPLHEFTLVGVKQDPSYFENKEPVLVYIGKRLKDSLRLEEIFTAADVDYGVEADEYRGGVIFRSVRAGAFFYVLPETVDAAHEIMRQNGYKPYIGPPPDIG